MTTHQLFLWEHAVLLYQNYEWQASIDLFTLLATALQPSQTSLYCQLNEGLIKARMGDVAGAYKLFQEVVSLDQQSIVARCALAEVEAIRGNYRQARYWYEKCQKMFATEVFEKELRDFGYCPTVAAISANIRALYTSTGIKADRANHGIGLERIPASRIYMPSTMTSRRASLQSVSLEKPQLKHSRTMPMLKSQPMTRRSTKRLTDGILPVVYEDDLVEEAVKTVRPITTPNPYRRLEARSARSNSESSKELAEFLRCAGPAGGRQYVLDHKYLMSLLSKADMHLKDDDPLLNRLSMLSALRDDTGQSEAAVHSPDSEFNSNTRYTSSSAIFRQ